CASCSGRRPRIASGAASIRHQAPAPVSVARTSARRALPLPAQAQLHAAPGAGLVVAAIAFVDDDRTDVGAVQQVVHAQEGLDAVVAEPPAATDGEVRE